MNVVLNWGKEYEEAMVVATTLAKPHRADILYGQRFGIESMHKDWKTNAFELEKLVWNFTKFRVDVRI